jgi:D-sedoheptulose 7-phosphate isomerase
MDMPMQTVVRRQLETTIATLTRVLADEALQDALVAAAGQIATAMRSGRKLLVCGNGGSAADAQHLVAEFVVRLEKNRPAMPAIALTVDSSILTAGANDFGFDTVFARQVEALGQPGDVLLAISTSGNSPNCIAALDAATQRGLHTIAFTGNDGGRMRSIADLNIVIPSNVTMHIQEAHLALEHTLCKLVEALYFDAGSSPISS